jgi:alpha-L-fucosidase
VERFFRLLPGYFNPVRYHPEEWAALAKLTGFEYVMFTAKHHAGFCMWDTATTGFSVMHTPYGKDVFTAIPPGLFQAPCRKSLQLRFFS